MTNATLRRLFILFVATVVVLALGVPSLAQDAEEESTDDATPVLEEIVVTAQKRTQNLIDVPVSVTAIGGDELELLTIGGPDVRFLSGRVPSVMIESSFGRAFPRFYIRGLGNTDFDLNASQPVSMVYDGVVLENPVMKGMPVWDLERIEVLRGPQGTLFGRNTPAGIIKFESKKPTQEFEAFVRGSYGTFDTADLKGAISGGLTDNLSARFSWLYQSRSDWVDNGFTSQKDALGGYDNFAYRAQLLWEPNDQFSGLLNVHGWDVDGTARIFRANILTVGDDEFTPGFDQETVFQDGLNQQDISANGLTLTIDYEFGNGTLTSVTGFETLDMFSRGDIDGGFGCGFCDLPNGPGFVPFDSESADGIPSLDQFTQEIRYATNSGGRSEWLVGLFFFDEDLEAETRSYASLAPGNPQNGYAFQNQKAESWAVFGSVDFQASDEWTLKAGLRYSSDDKELSAERPQPLFQSPTIVPVTGQTDADNVSWDLSATYSVNEVTNVYGRIATSYRAPSIQGRILFAPDFAGGTDPASDGLSIADTEEILSTEVGIKTQLLDRSMRLNASVYRYEVDDLQLTAVGGEFNVATLLNADKAEGYGFEADIQYVPHPDWMLTLGTSYNRTEMQDANLAVAPCGGGCTVLDPIGANGALVDGNSLPHAPEWIFNGILDYRRPAGGGEFFGSVDWAYYSEKQFFLYETAEFKSDGLEFGLRFGYGWNDQYEVALFGRNVTDEEIVRGGIDFNNMTGMTNDPATWGLEFSARF